jgi:hypothetical protein
MMPKYRNEAGATVRSLCGGNRAAAMLEPTARITRRDGVKGVADAVI